MRKNKRPVWKNPTGRHAMSFLVNLEEIEKEFQVTNKHKKPLSLVDGFAQAMGLMVDAARRNKKLIFVGNGGSAAIASHQAVDFWKNGGIKALTFNDASLLTCLGNDCGYENVFSEPVRRFAESGDVVLAISSSGRSPNILNAVTAARSVGSRVITFSGFTGDNPLRKMGDVNFFVPVRAYGLVEVSHLILIHAMLREIIYINPHVKKSGY
ncbi:MAG: SIS domain-containing protein [Elusimicrobia bacterium]|nr:SIS domain-containing protein [Elusimicrobiota bacterium]